MYQASKGKRFTSLWLSEACDCGLFRVDLMAQFVIVVACF